MNNVNKHNNKGQTIREMFSAIAPCYDLLNHLLSINLDRLWRKDAINIADPQPGQKIIDICCGSGDMVLEFAHIQPQVNQIVGVDFSAEMLCLAHKKTKILLEKNYQHLPENQANRLRIQWLCADAQQIPLACNYFDIASCAFGIRNVNNPQIAINQAFRLLKPGGKILILEFALPDNLFVSWCYQSYFRIVLPLLAAAVSAVTTSNKRVAHAYRYLPASVCKFQAEKTLEKLLKNAGFTSIQCKKLNLRTVLVYLAHKPLKPVNH